MNVRKACQTCKHWSPTDQTLDNGWRVFGTCRKVTQYDAVKKTARHRAGWEDDKMREQLKLDLKKAQFCVQSGEEGVPGYLRTGMDFYCNQWETAEVSAPAEKSLTGGV